MSLDFHTAKMLAALPYRQSFYHTGGWKNAPPPADGSRFQVFLNQHFTRLELDAAASFAAQLEDMQKRRDRSILPPGRPRRIGHVSWWDADYPLPLRTIFDPPPVLFYALYGDRFPNQNSVYEAIVGTRRPHRVCQQAVQAWVGQLSEQSAPKGELWIVSGFAKGVDRLAHEAALDRGLGSIAVLGSGLGKAGPRSNLDLLGLAAQKDAPLL
ncbi:MAG: hypothetical protein D6722_27715, partial [Bacteroidetes bacterium]